MKGSVPSRPKAQRFPALGVPHFRLYAITSGLSMVADNIEHVIGYWLIWELTHSTFWLGYAIIAHWLPFTLFSLHSGSLADRFDCRWLIQVSQGLYITASLGWGLLYLTGQLRVWQVAILLVFHGVGGLISAPSSMLIIHEMVGKENLVSAISLNASLRPLANMLGPLAGGVLMATVGPGWGFLVNVFIFLPLSILVLCLPYGGSRDRQPEEKGWQFVRKGLSAVRQSPTIMGVLVMVAGTSFLVGNAFQAFMPPFADRLGVSSTGYTILLAANGVGAILGTLMLGWIGTTKLRPVVVPTGALGWLVLLAAFAFSRIYLVSLVILCMVGAMQIVFTSMSQSIVQAWAPQDVRGRVMGVYNFATGGTRVISGIILGLVATQLGMTPTLLLLVGMIGLIVLGTSSVVRSTWQFEMKEETFPAAEGRVSVD